MIGFTVNININANVEVVLTEQGRRTLDAYRKERERQANNMVIFRFLECDKDGKFTTEFWRLMQIFGGKAIDNKPSSPPDFEGNVIKIKEDSDNLCKLYLPYRH